MYIVESGYPTEILANEAILVKQKAILLDQMPSGYSADTGGIRGRRRHFVASGEKLITTHEGEMLNYCRRFFGVDYVATRASYIYMSESDSIDFHHDAPACQVTIAICLTSEQGNLLLTLENSIDSHPQPGFSSSHIDSKSDARCDRVRLRKGAIISFEGRKLLHALDSHENGMILATMCYSRV
jgi:hypothetical protein